MKVVQRFAGFCCVLSVSLTGCNDSSTPEEPPPPSSFESTYAGLQSRLFEGQGCTETACHGSGGSGGLVLTADVSYEQLVEAPSAGSNLPRVEPGDRTRSYLYFKLLAAIEPDTTDINGGAMPTGRDPIPTELLEALRLWIYTGAPREGTIAGTAELLGAELPPVTPVTIPALPAPDPQDGFQLEMPQWLIPAGSEREVCFAAYYDVRDQVPDEYKDETGEFGFIGAERLRQDPQSHHLILNRSRVAIEDVHDEAFGPWTCRGGENEGETCEPLDLASCGTGHCTTEPIDGFACVGYGPGPREGGRPSYPIGGAQKAQDFDQLPDGVYRPLPLHGILLWNSHAFNLTTEDHFMNGRINYLYARNQQHRARTLFGAGAANIFLPNTAPFEREEICGEVLMQRGASLFALSSHTHKRGEHFTISHPDGTLLYENFIFNDPTRRRYDPPIVFDAEDDADRTLRYCAVYNNGVGPNGEPDPETVTRYSRLPDSVHIPGVPGICRPVACVAGKVGEACSGPRLVRCLPHHRRRKHRKRDVPPARRVLFRERRLRAKGRR
jgi:hypothetical protein